MASTLSILRSTVNSLTPGATPEAVQEFLNIGTQFLIDTLAMRGQTLEEWRTFRKQVIAAELAIIEEELSKLDTPLPT